MHSSWVGYVGLVAFALAWIPQSYDTIRAGHCAANRTFLMLAAVGSLSLTVYALEQGDPVFSALNALTTAGAGVNLVYSLYPSRPQTP
ncbi:MAG: hypothetical protein FD126_523 [Elusimicrobia bacterium]|nr:MAG: hypothetical protein FD126_523 [Elusimicrobiota bacterium]